MAKNLIGKRVRVQIGGNPPKDDDSDTIIGQDTTVYVPESEMHKYDKIVGEEISVTIGEEDKLINQIIAALQESNEPKKEEIIRISKDILKEPDKNNKLNRIKNLISIGAGVATIATFIMDLKIKLGL